MKFKSFLRRFFLGNEVLEKIHSPLNGEILVVEDLFGKKELVIGGVAQSGGLAKKLWSQFFQIPNPPSARAQGEGKSKIQNCLILGLGGGTVAKIISTKFPKSRIIGIEIDPLVVELGKKYFGLGEISNLKIVVGDAISLVKSAKFNTSTSSVLDIRLSSVEASRTKSRDKAQSFDLIIVDLYVGQEFPKEAEGEDFLRAVGRLANKGALVLFNRLYYNRQHRNPANQLVKKLTTIFPRVETKKLYTNVLILASF